METDFYIELRKNGILALQGVGDLGRVGVAGQRKATVGLTDFFY
jgi:hypothetical protein